MTFNDRLPATRPGRAPARTRSLILCLLFVTAVAPAGAGIPQRAAGPGRGSNTWSARSSTGLTLMGTWTAVADPSSGAVTGTWTLFDAQGNTSRRGGWSAAKSPSGWTGAWRASVAGGSAEYSGTWKAGVDLGADAPLSALLEAAAQAVVSGNWSAGTQSGAWSIRAFR